MWARRNRSRTPAVHDGAVGTCIPTIASASPATWSGRHPSTSAYGTSDQQSRCIVVLGPLAVCCRRATPQLDLHRGDPRPTGASAAHAQPHRADPHPPRDDQYGPRPTPPAASAAPRTPPRVAAADAHGCVASTAWSRAWRVGGEITDAPLRCRYSPTSVPSEPITRTVGMHRAAGPFSYAGPVFGDQSSEPGLRASHPRSSGHCTYCFSFVYCTCGRLDARKVAR